MLSTGPLDFDAPPTRDVVNDDGDAEASVLESLERHPGAPAPESVVGVGEITQEMLDRATSAELDLLGRELGVYRGTWMNGDPEADAPYREQLARRLQRRGT